MRELRKTDLKDFRDGWTLCSQCAGCYYHGPMVPHNWLGLPPPEWSPPHHKCPSYEYYQFRAYTAVGRGDLASMVFDNPDFGISNDLTDIVYACDSCGMCSEICPTSRPLMANLALREEIVRRGARRPAPVERMDRSIAEAGNIFGAKGKAKNLTNLPKRGPTVYFAGCNGRFVEPEVATASIAIMQAAGISVASMGDAELCCGFVAGHDGNTWLLEEQAEKNVAALREAGAKQVIVSCAHCYHALRNEYPLIVGKLPFDVIHIAELLVGLIGEKKIMFSQEVTGQVTYHDPCFLGRHSSAHESPRKVLKSIPGLVLAEMERSDRWSYCCGSGAKISSACFPDFGAATSKDRLDEAKRAAGTVVTACTTCYATMKRENTRQAVGLEVLDISQLVARSMALGA